MAKSKPQPRRRGYDEGGSVQPAGGVGAGVLSGIKSVAALQQIYKAAQGTPAAGSGGGAVDTGSFDTGNARGGKIKRTAGPRIGKDDGLIPAQRGEYVVRKSAVNKLGTKTLNTINKGKLPGARGR